MAQKQSEGSEEQLEQERVQRQQERLKVEREAILQAVDHAALALYEEIKTNRRGVAVTTISEGSCDACGSVLTPAHQQIAGHSAQLTHCPACGRILYAR